MSNNPAGQDGAVLLVEDDVPLRTELRDLLQAEGHAVAEAGDGWEALLFMRKAGSCSLVVLDIGLPTMSGWELMARMRGEDALKHIPVIILSARPVAEAEGGPPVFRKPIGEPSTLLEAIRRHRGASPGGR